MPTSVQVNAAVRTYIEAFNTKNKEMLLSLLTDRTEQIDPVGTPARVGREAIGGFFDAVFSVCKSISFMTRELYVHGDEAALAFTLVQHRKEGADVRLDGIDVFRIDDNGKILQVKGYPAADKPVA